MHVQINLLRLLFWGFVVAPLWGAAQYQPDVMSAANNGWKQTVIGRTHTGLPIYALTNAGDTPKPTVAIVTGYSRAYAGLGDWLLEQLNRLPKAVDYIILPNASPEAMQALSTAKYTDAELSTNLQPIDDDNDGEIDEDGPEDLNGDERISWMRIKRPAGGWATSEELEGLMQQAEQAGEYLLLPEGVDNDKDGQVNEDPKGGIDFNRNFTHNYPYGQGKRYAGPHPVASAETRAVADHLYAHPEVFAVVALGNEDNLVHPWAHNPTASDAKRPMAPKAEDADAYAAVSKAFKAHHPGDSLQEPALPEGAFVGWAYYHYGRMSFAYQPQWQWAAETPTAAPADSTETDSTEAASAQPKAASQVARFKQQAQAAGNWEELFVPWEKIEHPDFPNQDVEVGGLQINAMTHLLHANDDHPWWEPAKKPFQAFMDSLVAMRPRIELAPITTMPLEDGLHRIDARLVQLGELPAVPGIAKGNLWVKKVTVELQLNDNQQLIGGKRFLHYDDIIAGTTQSLSWIVKGRGELNVRYGSPQTGYTTTKLLLR